MKHATHQTLGRACLIVILAAAYVLIDRGQTAHANGVAFAVGDVLADVGQGTIRHFTPSGTLVDTLTTPANSYEGDGMCFDAGRDLFATQGFESNTVSKFDDHGNLLQANFGSGYTGHPESCIVDSAGHVYVGQPDGTHSILEFDSTGNLLNSFSPAVENRGTDWIDLAADQCTMYYTSEGSHIKRFNVCTNTQLPDFATLPASPCYAHRIRPNGEVLVACTSAVFRLSASGAVIQTFSVPNTIDLFALNLDSDGTSFWTADYTSGEVVKVDIATGSVLTSFTTPPQSVLGGLAIVGEINVGGGGDHTPPTCTLKSVINGPPKKVIIATQDSDGGLAAPPNGIKVLRSTNATVSIPKYSKGTTSEVDVTATKINQAQASVVTLQVTDQAGNTTTCDPVLTDAISSPGKPVLQTVDGVTGQDHVLTVFNGAPGLHTLIVRVNGKTFVLPALKDNEHATMDIAGALTEDTNSVTLIALGRPGGSATILFGNI